MPVMPQKLAGWRIEPPVSVPVAAGSRRAATAAAEPPDEPPGTRVAVPGVQHRAEGRVLVGRPIANSSQLSLPRLTQPARPPGARPRWRRTGSGSRQHLRAGGGGERGGDEDVLVRDRHAQQRRRPRPARGARRPPAPGPGRLRRRVQEGTRGRHGRRCVPAGAPARPLDTAPERSRRPVSATPSVCSRRARLIRSPWAPGTGRPRRPARCAGWPRGRRIR
jgi:hypothetical protein